MEKVCEFCMALRPVVYCQADAAHLCLSCDAKVHSANTLSNRHLRSLLCDSCRYRPASVHCLDHNMYTCRSCDNGLHTGPQQHQRRAINSYMGCPSAKDFAALWDLDLNELRSVTDQGPVASSNASGQQFKHTRVGSAASRMSCTSSVCLGMPNAGSSRQQQTTRTASKSQQQQSTRLILQQIVDLKRLQLNEAKGELYSPLIHGEKDNAPSSSLCNALRKTEQTNDEISQQSQGPDTGPQTTVRQHEELNGEPFPSPFSQLESLPFSTDDVSLHGETFWQCKSPLQTSPFMGQNMQDIGVCEDLCRDDFNIPDVDLTFQNYEELFGGEKGINRGSLDDEAASSILSSVGPATRSTNHPHRPIRPSYSTQSFSVSMEGRSSSLDPRENSSKRLKDKKKARLLDKNTRQTTSVGNADVRKRAKGRFDCSSSDTISMTRSY